MTMTEMLEATASEMDKARDNRQYEAWYWGKMFDIDGVGTILCRIQLVQGATTWMRQHYRRNWELNGKRISASKLKEMLDAQPVTEGTDK